MKQAVCYKCGKKFKHQVPDDAGEVTCFACDQISPGLDAALKDELEHPPASIMKGDQK